AIPDREVSAFLDSISPNLLFPDHDLKEVRSLTLRDLYGALLKAYNHLIRFSSHIAMLEPILEFEPPGTIEMELLEMITSFETSLNPYIAHNPYFQPVRNHMAKIAVASLEEEFASLIAPSEIFGCLRSLCALRM